VILLFTLAETPGCAQCLPTIQEGIVCAVASITNLKFAGWYGVNLIHAIDLERRENAVELIPQYCLEVLGAICYVGEIRRFQLCEVMFFVVELSCLVKRLREKPLRNHWWNVRINI